MFSISRAHMQHYQPSLLIYLTPVNVSTFYRLSHLPLSISSLTHSPKQSPSITAPLHFSPSLALFISPASTVNHSFPFPSFSHTIELYFSALSPSPHPLVCFCPSLSLPVIQAHGCSEVIDLHPLSAVTHIGSSQNTHVRTHVP